MTRERIGQVLFGGAAGVALLVYSLSAPSSVPWGLEAKMAARLAAGDGDVSAAWRVWGHFVEMFAGHFVALACVAAAVAAGLLAMTVGRYLGWRIAAAAALVWTFFPSVWNGVTLGTRGVCVVSGVVILLWELERIGYRSFERVRAARRSAPAMGDVLGTPVSKWNGRIVWGMLGAAGLFALVSVLAHDYQLGEPAGVYARGVVREAGERIIVLNGVADEQVVEKLRIANCELRIKNGEGFTAQVGEESGANFYRMGGRDSTLEGWERRWGEAKAFLQSRDPFVPVMRRAFAREGNCIANAMLDEKAWRMYRRIYNEVDPGNFAALVNQCEMMRRGHRVSADERRLIERRMEEFFADPVRRRRAREIARASGPVRSDPALIARLEAEARQRVTEKVANGELAELPKSWVTLIEWNNEMIASVGRGDRGKATRIARAILANGKWGGFIPANAILGTATAAQGDYAAAEVFFRRATATTNEVPAVVLNDYAHTLMCLGRLDEAEQMARRAVGADKALRIARRTLGEILTKRQKEKGR